MAIDNKSGQDVNVDYIHHKIHDSQLYHVSNISTSTADNAYIDMMIDSTSTTECHLNLSVGGGGDVYLEIKSSVTSLTSTALEAFNHKGLGTATAIVTNFYKNNTTTSFTGTTKLTYLVGGYVNNMGSDYNTQKEIILEGGMHLIRATNINGDAQPLWVAGSFYEITG